MKCKISLALLPELFVGDEVEYKPHYQNGCGHHPDEYVGSVSVMEKREKKFVERWYDIYVFEDARLCFRYGNEAQEYISPGSILDALITFTRHDNRIYGVALRLLFDKGRMEYQRNEEDCEITTDKQNLQEAT